MQRKNMCKLLSIYFNKRVSLESFIKTKTKIVLIYLHSFLLFRFLIKQFKVPLNVNDPDERESKIKFISSKTERKEEVEIVKENTNSFLFIYLFNKKKK
jgi:hypothetical protein